MGEKKTGRLAVQAQPATGCVHGQFACRMISRLAWQLEVKSPGFSSQILPVHTGAEENFQSG